MTVTQLLDELYAHQTREQKLRDAVMKVPFRMLRGKATQTSLSYKAEVPQSVLSKLENGIFTGISTEVLIRALRVYLEASAVLA